MKKNCIYQNLIGKKRGQICGRMCRDPNSDYCYVHKKYAGKHEISNKDNEVPNDSLESPINKIPLNEEPKEAPLKEAKSAKELVLNFEKTGKLSAPKQGIEKPTKKAIPPVKKIEHRVNVLTIDSSSESLCSESSSFSLSSSSDFTISSD